MHARSPSPSLGDLPKLTELLHAAPVEEFHPEQDEFRLTSIKEDEAYAYIFTCGYCQCDVFVSFVGTTGVVVNGDSEMEKT